MEISDKTAMVRIAEQIRISIKSELNLSQKEIERAGIVESSRDLSMTIDTSVDIKNLEGVSIVNRHHDKRGGITYSFATLDREQASFSLRREINGIYALASKYFEAAESHRSKADIAKAIPNYIRAIEEHKKSKPRVRLLNAITKGNSNSSIDELISLAQMEGELIKVISNCRLDIRGGNHQRGEFGEALKLPLAVSAIYEDGGRDFPIMGLPLKFTITKGSGTIQDEVSTDGKGIAKSGISRVEPSGVKNNIVEVKLNYPEHFMPHSGPKVHFTYLLPVKEDIKVDVRIKETNLGFKTDSAIVKPLVIKHLKDRGFSVLENGSGNANFTVKGQIDTSEKGQMGDIIFAISSGSATILDNKTGLIAGKIKIDSEDSKGAGLSKEAAGLNSLEITGDFIGKNITLEMEKLFNNPSIER
ncbi:MAG: hypothetical protein RQ824_04220 [bacterium]|nr:hypothetical protein [bacterium]